MIIVRKENGELITGIQAISLNYYSLECVTVFGKMILLNSGTGEFYKKAADWIFQQIKDQRGAANIIIDMTECPAIQNEGALADD